MHAFTNLFTSASFFLIGISISNAQSKSDVIEELQTENNRLRLELAEESRSHEAFQDSIVGVLLELESNHLESESKRREEQSEMWQEAKASLEQLSIELEFIDSMSSRINSLIQQTEPAEGEPKGTVGLLKFVEYVHGVEWEDHLRFLNYAEYEWSQELNFRYYSEMNPIESELIPGEIYAVNITVCDDQMGYLGFCFNGFRPATLSERASIGMN
jgi:hypothetical protein